MDDPVDRPDAGDGDAGGGDAGGRDAGEADADAREWTYLDAEDPGSDVGVALRAHFPAATGFSIRRAGGDRFYDVPVELGPDARGVSGCTYLARVHGAKTGTGSAAARGERDAEGSGRGRADEVVVKFVPGARDRGGLLEPRVARLVRAATYLPVPEILAVEDDPYSVPPYFVTERAPGEAVEGRPGDLDPGIRAAVLRRAGRHLGDLHDSVGFDRAGALRVDRADDRGGESADGGPRLGTAGDLTVGGHRADWPGHFRALTGVRIANLRQTPFADLAPAARAALAGAMGRVPDAEAVLVHEDYRHANLLVDPASGAITAVLDWHDVSAGDPGYGLAKAEYLLVDYYERDPESRRVLRGHLREGYREVRPIPDGYAAARPVYVLSAAAWQLYGFLLVVGNADAATWRPHARRLEERFRRAIDAVREGG